MLLYMKKGLFLVLLLCFIGVYSCSDDIGHQINGQWQLKTVDENGVSTKVDTIFYSFQRGSIFSFTTLVNENEAWISYGYVNVLSDNQLLISMDTTKNADGNYQIITHNFKELSGWNNLYNTFMVESIDGKNMVLSSEGKIYSFKKH